MAWEHAILVHALPMQDTAARSDVVWWEEPHITRSERTRTGSVKHVPYYRLASRTGTGEARGRDPRVPWVPSLSVECAVCRL